jgi:hypothetical protein
LEVRNLKVYYFTLEGVRAIDGVDFEVRKEALGVAGSRDERVRFAIDLRLFLFQEE